MPPHGNQRSGELGSTAALNEDGALDTPLHQLPGFGTGLHRRPVAFVRAAPASSADDADHSSSSVRLGTGAAVADAYLSLVLGEAGQQQQQEENSNDVTVCDVCGIAVSIVSISSSSSLSPSSPSSASPSSLHPHHHHHHHASLVHQLARGRPAPPPAAVDRRRFGFAVLAAQGWDPDSADTGRRGLGPTQQGRARALAPRPRPARVGLGAEGSLKTTTTSGKAGQDTTATARTARKADTSRLARRKEEAAQQRRTERLREQLLGSRDLDRYLAQQDEWE